MTAQEKRAARRAALIARLSTIRLWLFGPIAVAAVPGTVFDPRHFFADPGRLRDCLFYWRHRAARAGCGAGLPRALRDSALDDAAQNCLTHFLDADYRRLGITGDEFARAILLAFRRCRLAFWRDAAGQRDLDRARRHAASKGDAVLFNRAQNARYHSPGRIVMAAHGVHEDVVAITGDSLPDERPGKPVNVPGGSSGRGPTDGRMVLATVADFVVNIPAGEDREARSIQVTETRWKMVRGRGRAEKLPACTVVNSRPAPRNVFRQTPPPAAGVPGIREPWKPTQPSPAPSAADALRNLRRLGRGLDAPQDRRRIAAAIRAHRAAARR